MKRYLLLCFWSLALGVWAQQPPMTLCYDRPADFFEESLPIGNGKLGALVYGGADDNVVYLNDITFWTGCPVDRSLDAESHQWLPQIREALFSEDYARADSLQLHLQGPNSQYYQPLATLHVRDLNEGAVTEYHRRLSLDSAVVSDVYQRGDRLVSREYFASHPDGLIAMRIRGTVNVAVSMTGQTPHSVSAMLTADGHGGATAPAGGWLVMSGHATGDPRQSIHFCTIVGVSTDGRLSAADSVLTITGASEATLYIVNETSFNGFDRHPVSEGAPYVERAEAAARRAGGQDYARLRRRHTADYRRYYDRVKLSLQGAGYRADLPTDRLLREYTDRGSHARYLETLYFQYGRYLLIASSRTPGVPANLQGLWTPHLWSPWRGNYTVNINLEENYWPAFTTNLAEMATPLDGFVSALAVGGRHTARNYYGIQRGWCASHNSDIWAMTNPVGEKREKPEWANWNMGGAWLVNTLWERFLFTQDTAYLHRVALPLMKGAADFCLDWLTDNPLEPGELITAPSTSPENEYVNDSCYHGMTCYGGTADLAIIRELFTSVISACRLCGDSADSYREALARLHPYTIGRQGDLNEWYYDWDDYDPHHRHQSHLIGLYPGQHLAALPEAPALLKACERTLEQKGTESTGWSTGWRINLWARLHRGEQAYATYRKLLTYVSPDDYRGPGRRRSGGTYPNLMDAHPPFQIDGNLGGTAGVGEMLLQSTVTQSPAGAVVELLPALPAAWSEGSVSGLCARGGYELDFSWRQGCVSRCTLRAKTGGTVTLRYNGRQDTLTLQAGETRTFKTHYDTTY